MNTIPGNQYTLDQQIERASKRQLEKDLRIAQIAINDHVDDETPLWKAIQIHLENNGMNNDNDEAYEEGCRIAGVYDGEKEKWTSYGRYY